MEDLLIKASLRAGFEILDVYAKSINVEYKEDQSPLTEADQRAHTAILEILKPAGLPILSEEGSKVDFEVRRKWSRFFLVDPLDGTKEFVKRNGEFTVNIAVIDKGIPVMGVVYSPVLKKLYFGNVGQGAYVVSGIEPETSLEAILSRKVLLPKRKDPAPYIVVGSRSHSSPETEAYIEQLRKEKGSLAFTSMGSSLKICLVAEGVADIYPRFGPTMEWDTAAGHAIASAAGKSLTDHNTGKELLYNKVNLLNPWFIVR